MSSIIKDQLDETSSEILGQQEQTITSESNVLDDFRIKMAKAREAEKQLTQDLSLTKNDEADEKDKHEELK